MDGSGKLPAYFPSLSKDAAQSSFLFAIGLDYDFFFLELFRIWIYKVNIGKAHSVLVGNSIQTFIFNHKICSRG